MDSQGVLICKEEMKDVLEIIEMKKGGSDASLLY
jgi:hypothetical protein